MEIWKDIKDYEGKYQISNFGNIKRIDRITTRVNDGAKLFYKERMMHPIISDKGYRTIKLWKNGGDKRFFIHRLIAIAFIPNPENKPYINHKDGDKLNNLIVNLEWCTPSENQQHAYDTGLKIGVSQQGEMHGNARLSKEDILFIKNSDLGSKELSQKYKVTQSHINSIKSGRRWKHIK